MREVNGLESEWSIAVVNDVRSEGVDPGIRHCVVKAVSKWYVWFVLRSRADLPRQSQSQAQQYMHFRFPMLRLTQLRPNDPMTWVDISGPQSFKLSLLEKYVDLSMLCFFRTFR